MEIKKLGLFLVVLCHLSFLADPSPQTNTLPSVLLQENNHREKEMDKNRTNGSNGSASGTVRHFSSAHGGGGGRGGGGGGGRASGNGEKGNNGGDSTTPATAGGTAVIPLYAAGAANGHRPNNHHHSAGSHNWSSLGLPTLGAVILATIAFLGIN